MPKDMGNLCLECRKDTSFGSGRFVNRIPCGRETEEGYLCEECYTIDESEMENNNEQETKP